MEQYSFLKDKQNELSCTDHMKPRNKNKLILYMRDEVHQLSRIENITIYLS